MDNLKEQQVILLCVFFIFVSAVGNAAVYENSGMLSVASPRLNAGEEGELVLVYKAGERGVPEGHRLWIELPASWYGRLGCPRVDRGLIWQNENTNANGYFYVREMPSGISIGVEKGKKADILGTENRFVQVFSFEIRERALNLGESLELGFRYLVQNSKAKAPEKKGSGMIRWLIVDPSEEHPNFSTISAYKKMIFSHFEENMVLEYRNYTPQSLWLEVGSAKPAMVEATIPSIAVVGERVYLKIRLLDKYYNLCNGFRESVRLNVKGLVGNLPKEIYTDDNGMAQIEFTPAGPGTVRITADIQGIGTTVSNPLKVVAANLENRIFWGDIHSHSQLSSDGVGVNPSQYARDASALDFYAQTEHATSTTRDEWQQVKHNAVDNYKPGRFVTILAMEDSANNPSGHFNLYFNSGNAPLKIPRQLGDIKSQFGEIEPVVIQHHTGMQWGVDLPPYLSSWVLPLLNKYIVGPHVIWSEYKEVKRHAVEIYSLHGSSEYYNPNGPLSYENSDLSLPQDPEDIGFCCTGYSRQGPHYVRDGWAAGYVMGTVSGSDDHVAQPGKRGGGVTAVITNTLTREAVIKAIAERRTYVTTGDRIYLVFNINGQPMGSVIQETSDIDVEISAIGTDTIAKLELMRFDWQSEKWDAVIEKLPGKESLSLKKTIETPVPAIYYLRLEQQGMVNNRPVVAWSSPIWVGDPPEIK